MVVIGRVHRFVYALMRQQLTVVDGCYTAHHWRQLVSLGKDMLELHVRLDKKLVVPCNGVDSSIS